MQELKKAIILQLLYSDIFKHPLRSDELRQFLHRKISFNDSFFNESIDELIKAGMIQKEADYFYVFESGDKVASRNKGNASAKANLPKAFKIAQFINKFPFVEGVGISGSLSKGVLHDDGDFDFFIITKPNRLWISRTFLILYKKLFLLNSRKYFCVNYFIDSDNLEIEEKNRFTATEIATLIPASGDILLSFQKQNEWVNDFFPNRNKYDGPIHIKRNAGWSVLLSKILNGRFGEWLDEFFMKLTLKRWKSKFGEFHDDKFDLTMKSRKYISKHHPNDFQNKVLKKHQELINKFTNSYSEELNAQEIYL